MQYSVIVSHYRLYKLCITMLSFSKSNAHREYLSDWPLTTAIAVCACAWCGLPHILWLNSVYCGKSPCGKNPLRTTKEAVSITLVKSKHCGKRWSKIKKKPPANLPHYIMHSTWAPFPANDVYLSPWTQLTDVYGSSLLTCLCETTKEEHKLE